MKKKLPVNCSREHAAYLLAIARRERFISIARYLILIGFIALWEVFARTGVIDPFICSSPSRIWNTLVRLYSNGELFEHIWITLYETVVGFVLGTLFGTLIAILFWWSKTLSRILDPYLVVLNALPKIALGPILIVWFGAGVKSNIVMAILI